MQPFFNDNGFKSVEEGVFANDKKSVNVKYDEQRQMYILLAADIDEDMKVGEYKEINAWLFDDTQNAKDAESVGIDFVASLRKILGVKITRNSTNSVALPTASKSDKMEIEGFTKKMLDVFPVLKEEYKSHVSVYGNFLYLNFFGEFLIPQLKNLFTSGTKKQIKKFYDVLETAYVKGNQDTVNVSVAILCAASYKNNDVDNAIKTMLESNTHFLLSYTNFKTVFAKNKKLLAALVK